MSITHYGIYLAYSPTLDLRYEGLGRFLAAFIKGAEHRGDVRLVIVCPSWTQSTLVDLFQSEGISKDKVDIYYPKGQSFILKTYLYFHKRTKRKRKTNKLEFIKKMWAFWRQLDKKCLQKLLAARSIVPFIMYAILYTPALLFNAIVGLFVAIGAFFGAVGHLIITPVGKKIASRLAPYLEKPLSQLKSIKFDPKDIKYITDLYQYIEDSEIKLIHKIVDQLPQVKAWYSPTAFWPTFNQIRAPKLMCVPDVVLAEFPMGFSRIGGHRFLDNFQKVEQAIRGGEYFVTYSNAIKENTLVKKYHLNPANINVIHHAANTLDSWLSQESSEHAVIDESMYCQQLLVSAIHKATNKNYGHLFKNTEVKFFFYASQFRPSKNVITLLRAYKYLLRSRYISHKLILTGRPKILKEIDSYIQEHHLANDVLLLPGITMPELAACYKLADLVINPSLSEGGCPFTFTEALSVNTPVIMAKIPVTTEVITDEKLQEMMLFDPYDWRDLVSKVEWALANRNELLTKQTVFFNLLKERTWFDVVNDHLDVLDFIASITEKNQGKGASENVISIRKSSNDAATNGAKNNKIMNN